ncbi:MAG: acetyl-CoA acetyltransferase [Oscillospiraceae bacterium]|nr:acetyl-CoA acetyltransferase [Oscillospiraceae bacterium]
MKMNKRNKVYVLGGAQTDFSRNWSKEGKNVIALLREIINDTFAATGIDERDVRRLNNENRIACFIGNFIAEKYINQGHLGALLTEADPVFDGVPSSRHEAACASGSAALDAAMSKIQNGDYDVALVIGWELMKTVDSTECGSILGHAAYYEAEGAGVEFPFPKLFGRLADEMIKKYRLDEARFMDALSLISYKNYSNAKLNPYAQTRKWFMSLEQAKTRGTETNPFVGGGRLAVSDCSQVTDGAAAVVLASEAYCEKLAKKSTLPIVKGYGHRVAPMRFDRKIAAAKDSDHILPWTRQAVLDAYRRSGMSVNDIDFFETHDCFTSSEYAAISAFGMTGPGDEYTAVESGEISFEGAKPVNPSGGLIGCGHPVGGSGVRMFLDLYRQLTREAGAYQLKKAENGMMLNIGGSATTNYVFILGNQG